MGSRKNPAHLCIGLAMQLDHDRFFNLSGRGSTSLTFNWKDGLGFRKKPAHLYISLVRELDRGR